MKITVNKEEIKPKVEGKSDFFSWQLFRWVRKYEKNLPEMCQIWKATWSSFKGIDPDHPVLFIGEMFDKSEFNGRPLNSLCSIDGTLQSYAFHSGCDLDNWEDVTDWFWSEYMNKGVCLIHGDHAHNWRTVEPIRTCNYCGKIENQVTEMVERKKWVVGDNKADTSILAQLRE